MDLHKLRHSTAHVLASAVKELYPKAKLAIGPAIEEGFYYDFDNLDISEEDLPKIEKKMQEIVDKKLDFKKTYKSKAEAKKVLKNEPYKLELLKDIDKPSFYRHGNFTDLCGGPHVKNTSQIKAFKLLKLAGAYWKGSSKNKMLTRIYGISFPTKKELDDYLKLQEEAEKRDHRKIGRDLELFFFDSISPGSAFWMPKGMIIFKELEDYWRKIHDKEGYLEISTPILVKERLFKTSGHLEFYKENMFKIENEKLYLKPMNCPEATLVYNFKIRSYKDLPIKLSEIGRLHRNEISGVLGGLFRVRQITMDDAHIFCMPDQIKEEISKLLKLVKDFYKLFNFKSSYYLATMPINAMGSPDLWKKAEKALASALKANKIKYELKEKEGAFYGPKIDVHIKDALNRDWQLATFQLDFQMPERFKLSYEGKDGKKHRPVMIHRAIFGSFERFLGILTEHLYGKFPLWLSPVQVILLTLTSRNIKYSKRVKDELEKNNIRVKLDDRLETMNKKVRDAQLQNINYIVTIGDKEEKKKTLAVRTRDGKVKFGIPLKKFVQSIVKERDIKAIKISK